jgi:hypothetical protein
VEEVKEVSGTYFTSIAQKITEDKYAVKSCPPVQQKQVPVGLQNSHPEIAGVPQDSHV